MKKPDRRVWVLLAALSGCFLHAALARNAVPASATHATACPSRDFPEFLTAFSKSVKVQKRFTKYPLRQSQLDTGATPEPTPVERSLRRDQVVFPVMPNEAERQRESLLARTVRVTPNRVKVILSKEDTDYRVVFIFAQTSCWYLEGIENESL